MADCRRTSLLPSSGAMLLAQQPVRNLSQLWTVTTEGLAAATRIFRVIDTRPPIADKRRHGRL